jgi:predicted alpha-1,2-mannosidase
MKHLNKAPLLILLILIVSCGRNEYRYTKYVDPFIGTDAHGHVYPGATTPFGMVQLSPDTRKDSWDGCSGYHFSDSTIMGFSHTHLSGTGVGDYGDIRLMPTVGIVQLDPGTEDNPESGYRSRFDHRREWAEPGFYAVDLLDYAIAVELTASPRAGFHKYIFPESGQSNIIIDLTEGVTTDEILDLWIEVISDTEIQGFRRTSGWAKDQHVYFNATFSKPFISYGFLIDGDEHLTLRKGQGKDVKAWISFPTKNYEEMLVKVGLSAVSTENARLNRETELPGWNFEKARRNANKLWHRELSRIEVQDDDQDRKTVFYTALYRAMVSPNLYSDVDGSYRGHDMKIHKTDGFDYYTVFSLWDTFRTLHPMLAITHRQRTEDFIKTMLLQYQQGGLLPVWELAANETNCMIGYHAVPVIADAYMKGIRGFDEELALEAMVESAQQDHFGLEWYKSKGYIPADKESESVSKTLEYAYDDWCIAQMAKELGNDEMYEKFIKRAQYYKNIFDPQTGFMRAKINETWFSPFDPWEVNFNYTEANAWQYSMYVPQDVSGLMNLLGGPDSLAARLDQLFEAEQSTTGRHQSDITGLIGQYAHGNEPSHHKAYLYNFCGYPWKTQERVRQIMDELYTSMPDGLCGNEDCGQMSAWYIMSALGFYPVTPASNNYIIGSPVFDKVILHLENGEELIIEAENQSPENKYIQTVSFNGNVQAKSYLTHQQIEGGGYLKFVMGKNPNKNWGNLPADIPVSAINDFQITPVPFVSEGKRVFFDEQKVAFASVDPDAEILFHKENEALFSNQFTEAFSINGKTDITAKSIAPDGTASFEINPVFRRIPKNRNVTITWPYANQYSAGGDVALIDGLKGTTDFRTGLWQGYEKVDLEAVIDLAETATVSRLTTAFLQDVNTWIFMPLWVEYFVSVDGKNFRKLGRVQNKVDENDWTIQIQDFNLTFKPARARYIKVVAKNRGFCPDWHKGAGNPGWIFADEVVIE